MIQVKDNETGKVVKLKDDSALPALVQSGKVSIPQKEYEFQDEAGDKYKVPAEGFLQAIKSGWKYRDSGVIKDEELEKKYGDSEIKGTALGIARGLTMGLSDVALEKSGIVSEEALREIKNRNPISSGVGEAVGTIAPIAFSGGAGLVGRQAVKKLAAEGTELALKEAAELATKKSLVNQIIGNSPAGVNAGISMALGRRAAANIESKVAKTILENTATAAVDGALSGLGHTISEAELGNADFNAETLMMNMGSGMLTGGAFGGIVASGAEAIKKASRVSSRKVVETIVSQVDGDAALKNQVREKLMGDDAIEAGLRALKDPEIQKIKELYPDAPVTPGMESVFKPVAQAENYLFDAPTVQGESIRNSAKQVQEFVEKNVDEIWKGARDATPEETGNLIRGTFFSNINAPRESGAAFYDALMTEFGNAPVLRQMRTKVSNAIKASDAWRIGKEGAEIKRLVGILDDTDDLTLQQVKYLQKDIGASMKAAKAGSAERELLQDMYDQTRMLQENAIKQAVKGTKQEGVLINGLKAANADYVRAYEAKEEISELFGVKGKDFDTVLEKLENMSALDLEKRFLNIKKTDKAFKVLEKYPEVGKLVIRNRQNQLLNSHIKEGVVNYGRLKSTLQKMSQEERSIYFGGNKKAEQKMIDMLTLWEKRPKTLNPSGTDIRNEVRNLLNPKHMAQNWALGEIYKGNDSVLGKMVNKVFPTLSAIEKSSNRYKGKISSSVGNFFKVAKAGVVLGSIKSISEEDIDKAREQYELAQSNPEALLDKFMTNNETLSEVAPETANALQARIIAGVQFLQSKTPKRDQDYIGEKLKPSRSELIKFKDFVEAVEKPQVIFEQLHRGYLNPNTLEALRTVYPATYSNIQAEILAKMPKNLTRAQKIQLQPLLGSKVTPAMDYNNLMRLQGKTQQGAAGQQMANQEMNRVPMGAAQDMNSSERAQTSLAKTLNRP